MTENLRVSPSVSASCCVRGFHGHRLFWHHGNIWRGQARWNAHEKIKNDCIYLLVVETWAFVLHLCVLIADTKVPEKPHSIETGQRLQVPRFCAIRTILLYLWAKAEGRALQAALYTLSLFTLAKTCMNALLKEGPGNKWIYLKCKPEILWVTESWILHLSSCLPTSVEQQKWAWCYTRVTYYHTPWD